MLSLQQRYGVAVGPGVGAVVGGGVGVGVAAGEAEGVGVSPDDVTVAVLCALSVGGGSVLVATGSANVTCTVGGSPTRRNPLGSVALTGNV